MGVWLASSGIFRQETSPIPLDLYASKLRLPLFLTPLPTIFSLLKKGTKNTDSHIQPGATKFHADSWPIIDERTDLAGRISPHSRNKFISSNPTKETPHPVIDDDRSH